MSVKVANKRLIVSSLQAEFYQLLLSRVSDFRELGKKAVREAESATDFRDTNKLENLSMILSNIPIQEYQLIGQYYWGWAGYLEGESNQLVFEEVLEKSQTYKARAFIGLAAVEARKGDYALELKLLTESLRYGNTPSIAIESLRGIATVKAKEGFNKQSLRDLEQMWPLVRHGDLRVYHDYLNSLAVELGEVGRLEEAQNVCRIVLASPFAFAYPEWRETANEIALRGYKSRSAVSVIQPDSENVIQLPVPSIDSQPVQTEPARVLNYMDWKNKMVKKSNGDHKDKDSPQGKTERELFFQLTEIISKRQFDSEQLCKLIDFADKISSNPEPEPDKD